MQSLEIFRRYDVVLCDIDGVLHTGRDGIEGVPQLLRALQPSGPWMFFLTNNGSALPEQITSWLGQMGLEIPTASLITAGEVLVDAFRELGLVGAPVLNLGNEPAAEYVRRAGGVPIPTGEARRRYGEARAVVVGSTRHLNKDVLDAACNAIHLHRTPVLCTNPDVFAPSHQGEITFVAGGLSETCRKCGPLAAGRWAAWPMTQPLARANTRLHDRARDDRSVRRRDRGEGRGRSSIAASAATTR